jgi:hypothetical protein
MARIVLGTPTNSHAGPPDTETPGSGFSWGRLLTSLNTMFNEIYAAAVVAAKVVTSSALTTAAGADDTITVTNSAILATSVATASLRTDGTNSAGTPKIKSVTPGAGSLAIVVHNDHATDALNGTLKISYVVSPVI